ncbi:hypothetical protein [Methanobrevibacter sp. V14]|uniref:hypothetical protein n=1 Tax=Methanobrevibacter sp. V14 TaxID=3064280 RepID=UPI0027365AB7|nr:hypothetical protein [Methanobrevibacter sp. V14]
MIKIHQCSLGIYWIFHSKKINFRLITVVASDIPFFQNMKWGIDDFNTSIYNFHM